MQEEFTSSQSDKSFMSYCPNFSVSPLGIQAKGKLQGAALNAPKDHEDQPKPLLHENVSNCSSSLEGPAPPLLQCPFLLDSFLKGFFFLTVF